MEFSRKEYWSGLLLSTPWDFPNPGVEHESPALAGRFFTTSATWEAPLSIVNQDIYYTTFGQVEFNFIVEESRFTISLQDEASIFNLTMNIPIHFLTFLVISLHSL